MLYLTLLHYLLLNISLFLICQLMVFHPKHVLIKYEFQKHRMDHQSDILLRAAKKFNNNNNNNNK